MKVLTVVGTSEDREGFENALYSHLSDGFQVQAVIPLVPDGEYSRFLAYVFHLQEEDEDDAAEGMAEYLEAMLYQVHVHDNPEEAGEWASENHGDDTDTRFMELISAKEIYKRDVFFGLISIGDMTMIRCVFDGKPAVMYAHLTGSPRPNDALITPFALMIDENVMERIELPTKINKEDI